MVQNIPQRPVGSQGLTASAQGLGIMSFGNSYSDEKHKPTEKENQAVLERAVELGINLIDTADVYGNGVSEAQFGKAIKKGRDRFVVATKFSWIFQPFTPGTNLQKGLSGKPEYIRKAVEDSLQRLNTDHIDLYYQHRVDRTLPIEETWGELKKLVEEGKVKYLGISEASPEEIRKAHAVHPITAVQLEWSLWSRDAEDELIPTCRELGIGIVPYSPLGRGFLTGEISDLANLSENDRRRQMPRFKGESFKKNVDLVSKLKEFADKKGITPSQAALAWIHAQGEDVFPIPGTKRVKYLEENVAAFSVKLTKEEVEYLSDLFHHDAVSGPRYGEAQGKFAYDAPKKLQAA